MQQTDKPLLGLDVGGTKLAANIADGHGTILSKIKRPTDATRGPHAIVDDLFTMLVSLATERGIDVSEAKALGVSFGGTLESETGIVDEVSNLPGWRGFPLRSTLERLLPGVRVVIENDANAAALAEWRFGAGRGNRSVLYLTMGTGIGGGIIIDGRILRGATGRAGEIGHICQVPDGPTCNCGRRGCLEALCSGPAIARRALDKIRNGADPGDLAEQDPLTAEHIVAAAKRGNVFALQHVHETARFMAHGIGSAVNVLNSDVVILGTVATAAGDVFFDPLREALPEFTVEPILNAVEIVPAQLGDRVGDYAAIALVLD